MRFSTDDDTFAVIITPTRVEHSADFFGFQLVIAGETIGDEEPNILGSAINFLTGVKRVDDPRLAHPEADPDGTLALAIEDEFADLHDQICFAHAESLDRWRVVAYQHDSMVTWLAGPRDAVTGRVSLATIPVSDYTEIVEQATSYWNLQRRQ